jgi:hypothetical protein
MLSLLPRVQEHEGAADKKLAHGPPSPAARICQSTYHIARMILLYSGTLALPLALTTRTSARLDIFAQDFSRGHTGPAVSVNTKGCTYLCMYARLHRSGGLGTALAAAGASRRGDAAGARRGFAA